MNEIPLYAEDLIRDLRADHPMPCALRLARMSPTELQFEMGRQALIEFLEVRMAQTKKDAK